ncbi:putative adenylate kinase [Trichuris suis]|nr:putative adenylate kinase [Trichuris suis]
MAEGSFPVECSHYDDPINNRPQLPDQSKLLYDVLLLEVVLFTECSSRMCAPVSTIEKVDAAGGVPVGESELNTVEQMVGDVNKPKQVNENDQAAPDTDSEPSVLASSQPDIQQTPLDVPVVILLGCIGSQKTKLAKYAAQKLHEKGLTALHTSDLVKGALKDLEHVDLEALYEGRLVSDDVINRIVYQAVSDVSDKSDLVLINGYPLTMEQLNYMKPAVALIDYHLKDLEKQFEERQMNSAESKNRIDEFVSKTMPVVKQFEDQEMLQIIPGECGSEAIEESIVLLLRGLLDPESVKEADKVNVESSQLEEVKATEQKEELREAPVDNGLVCFEAPVVLIVGAPGSFKSKYCAWLTDHFDGIAHVSMGQLIADAIEANPGNSLYEKASEDMKAGEFISKKLCFELISQAVDRLAGKEYLFLLIEGYPRDLEEMSDLSTLVKDIKMVILIDCTEKFCEANVRRKMNGLRSSDEIDVYVSRCIQSFKVNTLPMLKYFDERKLLRLVRVPTLLSRFKGRLERNFQLEGDKGVEDLLPEILNTLETTFGCLKGGPGSGKGTQCAKIVQKYKLTHLSSGDLLRADVESGSQRGKQIKEIMANGQLVALEIVLDLIKEAMLKALTQGSKGFLIDGFPRDVTQGEKFEAEILPCAHVLFFDVSEDTMIKRLIGRGASSGRVDDNMETIKKRLETFRKQTQPVVDYYREKKKLAQIKAEGTVDEIFAEVDKVMQKHVK